MVHTNHIYHTPRPVYHTPRPAASPLLELELLNAKGNKKGTVVYCEESGLLKYDGKNYKLECEFPEDHNIIDKITEVFLIPDFHGEEIMFVDFKNEDFKEQVKCRLTVLPSDDEKVKLTTMYKDLGTELAKEAEKVEESLKRVKTLIGGFNDSVAVVCPGFNFAKDIGIDLPTADTYDFRKMEDGLRIIQRDVAKISDVAEPFSKKRKSCD
jgi:hypothetical protein